MKIDDSLLSHLFLLSRIKEETDPAKREKLLEDFSRILDHFTELNELDTTNVEPVSGGTFLSNVLRSDEVEVRSYEERMDQRKLSVEQFPHSQNGALKVPPVFE